MRLIALGIDHAPGFFGEGKGEDDGVGDREQGVEESRRADLVHLGTSARPVRLTATTCM